MDLASLEPASKIAVAVVALVGAPKVFSDLYLNRVVQRKHAAELIEALTTPPKDGINPHPMVIQAKFHAAFGGESWLVPEGKDIRDFFDNGLLSTFQNALSFAACLPFVTYSKLADGFIPRTPDWTAKKIHREYLYQSIAYWVAAVVTTALFAASDLGPGRLRMVAVGAVYSFAKAYRAGVFSRALRLLQLTPKA